MRAALAPLLLGASGFLAACGGRVLEAGRDAATKDYARDAFDSGAPEADGCAGGECVPAVCEAGTHTTIRGYVLDPGATFPVYNAVVYAAGSALLPLPQGAICPTCDPVISGSPYASTLTDTRGKFVLEILKGSADGLGYVGEPSVTIVVQKGRWRRNVTLAVYPCVDNAIDSIHLPARQSEGDLPRIAVATGDEDTLECTLRRIGFADSEFTAPTGKGRVHLYKGFGGSGAPASAAASALWGNLSVLKTYDMVLLSSESADHLESKTAAARQAMHDYAGAGGRILATHHHHSWFSAGPSDFKTIATWTPDAKPATDGDFTIDTSFPRGKAFSDWLLFGGVISTAGVIHLTDVSTDFTNVSAKLVTTWITKSGTPKDVTFRTPTDPKAAQCGLVHFLDFRVGRPAASGGADFPKNCAPGGATPQERAFEFQLLHDPTCFPTDPPPTPP